MFISKTHHDGLELRLMREAEVRQILTKNLADGLFTEKWHTLVLSVVKEHFESSSHVLWIRERLMPADVKEEFRELWEDLYRERYDDEEDEPEGYLTFRTFSSSVELPFLENSQAGVTVIGPTEDGLTTQGTEWFLWVCNCVRVGGSDMNGVLNDEDRFGLGLTIDEAVKDLQMILSQEITPDHEGG